MNSVCGLFKGTQKPDEKSDSILEMDNRFRSGGIGKLIMFYALLYQNRWILVKLKQKNRQIVIYLDGLKVGKIEDML
jgi:hypothetical protein